MCVCVCTDRGISGAKIFAINRKPICFLKLEWTMFYIKINSMMVLFKKCPLISTLWNILQVHSCTDCYVYNLWKACPNSHCLFFSFNSAIMTNLGTDRTMTCYICITCSIINLKTRLWNTKDKKRFVPRNQDWRHESGNCLVFLASAIHSSVTQRLVIVNLLWKV